MVVGELEHIKPILSRALRAVVESWEEREEREEIEDKNQEHNTPTGQI